MDSSCAATQNCHTLYINQSNFINLNAANRQFLEDNTHFHFIFKTFASLNNSHFILNLLVFIEYSKTFRATLWRLEFKLFQEKKMSTNFFSKEER